MMLDQDFLNRKRVIVDSIISDGQRFADLYPPAYSGETPIVHNHKLPAAKRIPNTY